MSIESSLERIAVALEKIASHTVARTPDVPREVPVEVAKAVAALETAVEKVQDDFATRDKVKAELTALAIPFNNKARTDVLAKLLEDVKAKNAAGKTQETPAPVETPVAEVVAPPTTPAPASSSVEPSISVDVVREAVKKYAAIQGSSKAIALLAKYKANKVSDLSVDTYRGVVDEINGELK